MKRWMVVLLLCCSGCGSSDPMGGGEPAPGPGVSTALVSIVVDDLNAYLTNVSRTYQTVNLMNSEFGAISLEWSAGVTSNYWTRQFTLNLITRLEILQGQVQDIRPENEQLKDIHTEYEQGLVSFQEAFTAFITQIDFPTSEGIDGVNLLIFRGNQRLDRFELLLSNLAGQQIQF